MAERFPKLISGKHPGSRRKPPEWRAPWSQAIDPASGLDKGKAALFIAVASSRKSGGRTKPNSSTHVMGLKQSRLTGEAV